MNRNNVHERIPWLAWPSVLSLDAVLVAVVWQQLLLQGFCDRGSTWSEAGSLGATVWLIYVADRLLDAVRLDVSAPHTLRHGFYLRHRRVFIVLWIAVLTLNAFVVVHYLPHELLRGGVLLATAVLIYGAGVHFSPLRSPVLPAERRHDVTGQLIPKEVRVGMLFSLGVTLSVWTEMSSGETSGVELVPLTATTGVLAVLFAGNCMLVAQFEREMDEAQSFPSIATESCSPTRKGRSRWVSATILSMMLLPLVLIVMPMPALVLLAAAMSAAGLCVAAMIRSPTQPNLDARQRARSQRACGQRARAQGAHGQRARGQRAHGQQACFDVRGAWVDAAVWAPPLTVVWLGLL